MQSRNHGIMGRSLALSLSVLDSLLLLLLLSSEIMPLDTRSTGLERARIGPMSTRRGLKVDRQPRDGVGRLSCLLACLLAVGRSVGRSILSVCLLVAHSSTHVHTQDRI